MVIILVQPPRAAQPPPPHTIIACFHLGAQEKLVKMTATFFDIHLGTKYSKHFEQFESGPIFLFPGAATQLAGAGPI